MIKPVAAAFAACLFASSVQAEPHEPKPGGCLSLEVTQAAAKDIAARNGGQFIAYEGDAAKKLMQAINAMGEPTSFKADHVGILAIPDKGSAAVLMSSGPCGYGSQAIVMKLPAVMKAVAFAIGESM